MQLFSKLKWPWLKIAGFCDHEMAGHFRSAMPNDGVFGRNIFDPKAKDEELPRSRPQSWLAGPVMARNNCSCLCDMRGGTKGLTTP